MLDEHFRYYRSGTVLLSADHSLAYVHAQKCVICELNEALQLLQEHQDAHGYAHEHSQDQSTTWRVRRDSLLGRTKSNDGA